MSQKCWLRANFMENLRQQRRWRMSKVVAIWTARVLLALHFALVFFPNALTGSFLAFCQKLPTSIGSRLSM